MDAAIKVLILSEDEGFFSLIQKLIIDDKSIVCSLIKSIDDEVLITDKLTSFFENIEADVIVVSDSFLKFSILELIKLFKRRRIFIPILVVSQRNEISLAVEVIKGGGENFFVEEQLSSRLFTEAIYSALQSYQEQEQLEKVRLENQKLSTVINQSPVSVVITKAETNKIEYANPMFSKLTGYSFVEVIGQSPNILKSGVKLANEYEELWNTILSGLTWRGEFVNRKKSGELYCVSSTISPVKMNNSETTHYVGIHEDITLQKEAELKLKRYAERLEKKSNELEKAYQAIEQNIKKAKRLHRHFFPTSFPQIDNIQLEAFYKPAHNIGSDYYNFIKIKNQLIVYVVDVSGSGIDGAFINIFIRQKINRFLYAEMVDEEIISPKLLLNYLAKNFILEKFPDEYFICLYVCVLNLETNLMTYSNAGIQVPPAIASKGQLYTLNLGGLPISSAIDTDLLSYEEETVFFDKNSSLLISTDGIVESEINGEMYGVDRLHQLVLNHHYLPPKALKNAINRDIDEIFNSTTAHDDITYVIVQHSSKTIDSKDFFINSNVTEVEEVVQQITELLLKYTFDVNCILVGFNEMIYNAIEHGNKFHHAKQVHIHIEVKDQFILISIKDEGEGFNWRAGMKKQLDFMNFEERGRGIIFTKASFDFVTYNKKGNMVYLFKKR